MIPLWMRVMTRGVNALFALHEELMRGSLNIIDLKTVKQ